LNRCARPTLALIAALALLAGCSGDGSSQAAAAARTKANAASPSAAATETTKPYTPPARAPGAVPTTSPDKTTAGTFVLVWFETLNYGYRAGDADPLRQTVTLGCFTCVNWILEVQNQADKHLKRTGGYVHVRELLFDKTDKGDYIFRAALDRDPGVLAAPDGTETPISASSGEVVELRVGLTKSGLTGKTSWTMKSVTTPTG
jgi:hypothetical protein